MLLHTTGRHLALRACNPPECRPGSAIFGRSCEKQIKNGEKYYNDRDPSRRLKLCGSCYFDMSQNVDLPGLIDFKDDLHQASFDKQVWKAKEQEDYDHYVQCDGPCRRWYHYICAFYPDAAQLTRDKELEDEQFICQHWWAHAAVAPTRPSRITRPRRCL